VVRDAGMHARPGVSRATGGHPSIWYWLAPDAGVNCLQHAPRRPRETVPMPPPKRVAVHETNPLLRSRPFWSARSSIVWLDGFDRVWTTKIHPRTTFDDDLPRRVTPSPRPIASCCSARRAWESPPRCDGRRSRSAPGEEIMKRLSYPGDAGYLSGILHPEALGAERSRVVLRSAARPRLGLLHAVALEQAPPGGPARPGKKATSPS